MKKKYPVLFIAILLASLFIGDAGIANAHASTSLSVSGEVSGPATSLTTAGTANVTGSLVSTNRTVTLKNPTFQELKDFVLSDPTHRHAFIPNEYECRNFATDMINDAFHKGILAGFVLICYGPGLGQHAVVAFNTTDRGLIYIEPQTNAAINIKVGGTYQGMKIDQILIAW